MPIRNAQHDRDLHFIPNRILKAEELIRIQDMDQARDVRGLGTLFNVGSTLNVRTVVNGSSVSLSPADAAYPMWVFVNGAFEPFLPVSFNLDPSKVSGDDHIYLNWVVWRVTADGEVGTIPDASLVDLATGEKVAEVGQLELTVSTADSSATARDADKQFAKNTTPVVMYRLERGAGGSVIPHATPRLIDPAAATKELLGFVKLSTDTSKTAIADDDPRLSELGSVPNRSINDWKCIQGRQVAPPRQTPWFGVAEADISGDYGISSNAVFDRGTKTLLSDILPSMVSLLLLAIGRPTDVDPSPAPQQAYTPPPAANVPSEHVGQPLGLSGTHPAIVNSDLEGFTVKRNSGGPGGAGSPAAFGLKDATGKLLAGITHDGDVTSDKAKVSTVGQTALNTLSTIAATLATHINAHPGGGGGVAQAYVDNADNTKLAEAKQYADQLLGGSGVHLDLHDVNIQAGIHWKVITIGNLEVAIALGTVQNGTVIAQPPGFAQNSFFGTASFGRSFGFRNAEEAHCYLDYSGTVVCYVRDRDGNQTTGDWANVVGVNVRWV